MQILSEEIVKNICKIGHLHNCCRYLAVGSKGFECLKNSTDKAYIDKRVREGTMIARGNNCQGICMRCGAKPALIEWGYCKECDERLDSGPLTKFMESGGTKEDLEAMFDD